MSTVIEECDLCGKGIPPIKVHGPCIVTCTQCSDEISAPTDMGSGDRNRISPAKAGEAGASDSGDSQKAVLGCQVKTTTEGQSLGPCPGAGKAREVQVGAWVMSEVTGKQGLVTEFNPMTRFFTIEGEKGDIWTDTTDFLIFVS